MKYKNIIVILGVAALCAGLAKADPKADIQEFVSGAKTIFDSSDHGKAAGVRVKMALPKSWQAIEGTNANVIQKFISNGGRGPEIVAVSMQRVPPDSPELSKEEKMEMLTESSLKTSVPPNGKFISYKLATLDGELCGVLEMSTTSERNGIKQLQFITNYTVPLANAIVLVAVSSGGSLADGAEVLEAHYREAKPLFQHIVASCKFPKDGK